MKTKEELKSLNEEQLIALGAEELAAAVIMLTCDLAELEEKSTKAEEYRDMYYRWYNEQTAKTSEQIDKTSELQKKLDAIKGIVSVI